MLSLSKILYILATPNLLNGVVKYPESFFTHNKGVVPNSYLVVYNAVSEFGNSRGLHPHFILSKLFNNAKLVKQFIKRCTRCGDRYVYFTKRSLTNLTILFKCASFQMVQNHHQTAQGLSVFQGWQKALSLWRGCGFDRSIQSLDFTHGQLRGLSPQLIYETDLNLRPFGGRLTPYI